MDLINYTRIPNNLIKDDSELTSKELLIATTLLTTLNSKNICVFNLEVIFNLLSISTANTRARKEIKNILILLKKMELFNFYNDIFLTKEIDITTIDKNTIIYGLLLDDIDSFTTIKDEELYEILNYSKNNKIDTSLLLNTLLYILSFINTNESEENYGLAYPSIATIAEDIGTTEKSVLKYINILKDLNILVFDYVGVIELRSGEIRNSNMYYARKEDEYKLLNKIKEERNKKGFIILNKLNKDKSNLKRKLKQEINYLNKKDKLNLVEEDKLKTITEEYKKLVATAPAED